MLILYTFRTVDERARLVANKMLLPLRVNYIENILFVANNVIYMKNQQQQLLSLLMYLCVYE